MVQILEREILNNALADLRNDGFDVFLAPANGLLPAFLGNLRPDAIATKGDQGVVVEVVTRPNSEASKTQQIREALSEHKNWQLRVLLLNASEPQTNLPVQTLERLKKSLNEIERLKSSGLKGPALLVGWATFEALARVLLSGRFTKPQPAKRLVDQLVEEGFLTPDEADRLRDLAEKRNRLTHGALDVAASRRDLDFFVGVLKVLAIEAAPR
jgi:uncharacterized protein YutE (UPF0331/DUF86 family)